MKANQARYPLSTMARPLKVLRSGFHAWNGRSPSPRVVRNKLLLAQIRAIHSRSCPAYTRLCSVRAFGWGASAWRD